MGRHFSDDHRRHFAAHVRHGAQEEGNVKKSKTKTCQICCGHGGHGEAERHKNREKGAFWQTCNTCGGSGTVRVPT
jgi:DnaJ-class molecular chaperone